ncbi:diguanylate cyclase [Lederbergia galactosidilytica]|nr:diguanylate cyclase [Lederbergia galactosidilytica]MBP1914205.1 PleD family two-component response regulator [Lederbergia galactosidilytica]
MSISISIGVASFQETTIAPTKLVEDGDKVLYNVKRLGRNRVCIADQSQQ